MLGVSGRAGWGACRAGGGHGQQLGAGDVHGRRIRGPGTVGWGLYFMRGRALAASPGSWGSGCYIKANNAAVVPSLPSPEVGRTWEPPNWTIIAHICWLTCAADGNSVCRLQRAAALVMERTVKSGSGERPESGSRQLGDENSQPCGGNWAVLPVWGCTLTPRQVPAAGSHVQEWCGATGPGNWRGYWAGVLPGPCLWGGPAPSRLTPWTSHIPWCLGDTSPTSGHRPAMPLSLWQIPKTLQTPSPGRADKSR